MKKFMLLSLFAIIVLSLNLTAQVTLDNVPGKKYSKIDGAIGDTLTASVTSYSTPIEITTNVRVNYEAVVKLDSISGSPNVTVNREWSIDNVEYFTLDTVVWAGVSTDTLISYINVPFYGQFMRVKYTATATAQKSKYTEWWKPIYTTAPK